MNTKLWSRPATIERNNFKHKSLSCWSYNIAVGCEHACRFCYVPEVSTNRMATKLAEYGVKDPDAEWGDYVFLRKWDSNALLNSLRVARTTPINELNADGNRAVMLCTTTDPYQTLRQSRCSRPGCGYADGCPCIECGLVVEVDTNVHRNQLVRGALTYILEESNLNVRILTRSPLARLDFDLMKRFGNRLLFGMSLPTLNNRLARIYEPNAPAPTQRLATLKAAKEAGLNVYVAVAPVYPECDAADMEVTLRAIKELDPVTIFMEPINIRADNVARIEKHAHDLRNGPENLLIKLQSDVFATKESWRRYAVRQMRVFENLSSKVGLEAELHLWPDASLGSHDALKQFDERTGEGIGHYYKYPEWLAHHWKKISAWPTKRCGNCKAPIADNATDCKHCLATDFES